VIEGGPVFGDAGPDDINVLAGGGPVYGGTGNDHIYVEGRATVYCGDGYDTVEGWPGELHDCENVVAP
jgi:hypothetical protein